MSKPYLAAISLSSPSARICSLSSSRSRMISSVDHSAIERGFLLLLALDQPVDAVERDAAVIADDPAAAIGVGKAGQDVRTAAAADVGGIGVEHARRCASCDTW